MPYHGVTPTARALPGELPKWKGISERGNELSGPQHGAFLVLHLEDAVERQVTDALGESGTADPTNVALAAKVLGEYADAFKPLEAEYYELAAQLQEDISSLGREGLVD